MPVLKGEVERSQSEAGPGQKLEILFDKQIKAKRGGAWLKW
jgi:hypothetical protein